MVGGDEMSKMACYKCKATEELSAKNLQKNGTILFICKPCRRKDANSYYERKRTVTYTKQQTVSKNWIQLAKEKNSMISEKYQDLTFMKVKGVI